MRYLILLAALLFAPIANAAEIINLKDDEAVRSNEGTLVIEVEADKPFSLLIDSQVVQPYHTPTVPVTVFTLYNVDRGTHLLQVVSEDKVNQIFIHMLRAHAN